MHRDAACEVKQYDFYAYNGISRLGVRGLKGGKSENRADTTPSLGTHIKITDTVFKKSKSTIV